jgi:hypothetical protein
LILARSEFMVVRRKVSMPVCCCHGVSGVPCKYQCDTRSKCSLSLVKPEAVLHLGVMHVFCSVHTRTSMRVVCCLYPCISDCMFAACSRASSSGVVVCVLLFACLTVHVPARPIYVSGRSFRRIIPKRTASRTSRRRAPHKARRETRRAARTTWPTEVKHCCASDVHRQSVHGRCQWRCGSAAVSVCIMER